MEASAGRCEPLGFKGLRCFRAETFKGLRVFRVYGFGFGGFRVPSRDP